ncbi:hypothetical protein P4N68_06700 [Corynebacterium felinum]|uniref:Integral membrane protein n=1 Tax=Corynebacterium felinum TaxID=131318 RepID=A0ABU2B7A4_9CORY|nr:hypothetical protein [Corynebacterium felinum]MDF5820770.1 hypothetical protein [Corynebacterium felinum]MDR7354176.1 hypothetical protein [Corynebacterium felinum]WJY96347.1 hypothetical protein CFELI_13880 [Corynebacterium felinum]
MVDHPENDLSSDADQPNRFRPEPKTFDDLANTPDPLIQAQLNQRSTRQAIAFAIAIPILTGIVAFALAALSRSIGGPLCDAGTAYWICSREAEIWWPATTSIIPMIGVFGTAIILYRKYLNYTRWRPWMGTLWFLVPFAMLWMVTVFQMSIVGH